MQLYSALVLPMIKESLQNFIDTEIYLCRYEIDYLEKEELYLNSKCLWVWEQIETSKWKLVKIERIWEINSIWTFNVENDQEINISDISMIKWEIWNNFETRLNESIKTQYNIFHSDLTTTKKWKWVFIEVKKANINTFNTDCYYKREQVYSLPLNFDSNWILFKKESVKYFQIYNDTYYDLEKKLFIKWDNQIVIDKKENLLLECIIKNFPNTISKEKLMDYIYYDKDINNGYKKLNDKLLQLKRNFINKYSKKLWITPDVFRKEILIAEKYWWYRINWNFVNEI